MKKMEFQSVKNLKNLLKNTPKETLDKIWQEVKAMELSGPTSDELILQQSLICSDSAFCEASIDQHFITEGGFIWSESVDDALAHSFFAPVEIRVAGESNYALAA